MIHPVLLLLALGAFASLALATERQQETVFRRSLPARTTRVLWFAGWALLLVALFVAVRSQGWSFGLVSYSGHTSLAAGLVFVGLVVLGRRG
ncbi:DUF3325 domain-containing protein [Alcaligenaceae bacterium]|nr:DUF3325 domain-containing protein [Alcaligenaceae bacterium]